MPRPAQKNFGPVQLLGLGGGSRRNWGVSSAATKLFLAVPTVDVMCVLVDEIWLDGWFLDGFCFGLNKMKEKTSQGIGDGLVYTHVSSAANAVGRTAVNQHLSILIRQVGRHSNTP